MEEEETEVPPPSGSDPDLGSRSYLGSLLRRVARARSGTLPSAVEVAARYEDMGELGRGGMGEVHQVFDSHLRRDIAMKSLRIDEPDAYTVQRFVQEAQVTGQLDHPNIPPVYDIGVGPTGAVYFTMKQISGETLRALLRREEGPLVRHLGIFQKVCEAVSFAHAKGVLHRDLKPSNVMVGAFGAVYVLDWGLAKLVDTDDLVREITADSDEQFGALTQDGAIMGTPAYMSPEQAQGPGIALDERTDVYSLGAVLYVVLTGRSPFPGKGWPVVKRVLEGAFPPPRSVRATVPPELEAIALRAMALDPADRYPSVRALHEDIERYLEGRPVAAMRYSLFSILAKWERRHRRLVGGLAAAAAAAAAALAIGGTLYVVSVREARDRAVAAEREAALSLAQHQVALARAEADLGRLGAAEELLTSAADLLVQHGADDLQATVARAVIRHANPPPELTWSADGQRIEAAGFSHDRGSVWLSTPEGVRSYRLPLGAPATSTEAPPDGELLSPRFVGERLLIPVAVPGAVRIIDAATDAVVAELGGPPERLDGFGVQLDDRGERAVVFDPARGARLHDLADGTPLGPLLADTWFGGMARDGARVAGFERQGDRPRAGPVFVWDTATGARLAEIPPAPSGFLSPDGTRYLREADGRFWMHDVDAGGAVLWSVPAPASPRMQFTADGSRIVVAASDQRIAVLSSADGAVEASRPITGGPTASQGGIAVAPDGLAAVVLLGDKARLWSVGSDILEPGFSVGDNLTGMDLSPDGLLLATAGSDPVVRVWEWRSASLLRTLPTAERGSRDAAFEPGGTRLLTADRDGRARLFELVSGALERTLEAPGRPLAMAAEFLGPDDAVVAYRDGAMFLFDLGTGVPLAELRGDIHSAWAMELTPDRRTAILTGRGHRDPLFEVWDLPTRTLTFAGAELMAGYRAAVAPDGVTFAVANHAGVPQVWSVGGTEPQRVLPGRDETTQAVAFSADGLMLATGAYDGQLELYARPSWSLLQAVPLHSRSIVEAAFAPGSRVLLTASGGGRVVPLDLRAEAASTRGRVLELDPGPQDGTPELWAELARVAAEQRQWPQAVTYLEAARRAGGAVEDTALARALWAVGRKDDARRLLPEEGLFEVWRSTP